MLPLVLRVGSHAKGHTSVFTLVPLASPVWGRGRAVSSLPLGLCVGSHAKIRTSVFTRVPPTCRSLVALLTLLRVGDGPFRVHSIEGDRIAH